MLNSKKLSIMKNLRNIFYCIFAILFTASIIISCTDVEDGLPGTDGSDGRPGSVVTIGDNCNWWIDGVDTQKPACATQGEPGESGSVIRIGENGNWWINDEDTDIPATGPRGAPGSVVRIGENDTWWIDDVDTGIRAQGSVVTIGPNGNWFIDGVDTGHKAIDPLIIVDFEADKLIVDAGGTINFTDMTNVLPESWEWTFAHESGTPELKSNEQDPQITFDVAGVYTVTLVVTHLDDEYSETKDDYITVIDVSVEVDFQADLLQVYTGGTISFTDLTSVTPESWEWTFAHESGTPVLQSTERNPQITFGVVGAYTVTLEVTYSGNEYSETKNDYIKVFDIPTPAHGLIGHWLFDNESDLAKATVGLDLIPVGSGFTIVDGPTPTSKAVRVAAGSYYKCLPGILENTDVYTIMMNVKKTGTATYQCALAQMTPENTDNAELLWGTGTAPGIDGMGNPTNHYCLPVNSWHQIVMVSNGNTKNIYIDGELAYTGTSNDARYLLNKAGLLFFTDSRSGWDNNMDVAEIAIWNLALTVENIHGFSGLEKLDKTEWLAIRQSGTGTVTNLFDGNVTTSWNNSAEPPHYAVIDLGSQRNISRIIVVGPNSAANMPRTVRLFTSVGDIPPDIGEAGWEQVGEIVREVQSVNGVSGNFLTWNFTETSVTGRFLQIYLPDRWGTGLNVAEISVYEKIE